MENVLPVPPGKPQQSKLISFLASITLFLFSHTKSCLANIADTGLE